MPCLLSALATASCGADTQEGQLYVVFWIDGYLSHATSNLVIDGDTLAANLAEVQSACAAADPASPVLSVVTGGE